MKTRLNKMPPKTRSLCPVTFRLIFHPEERFGQHRSHDNEFPGHRHKTSWCAASVLWATTCDVHRHRAEIDSRNQRRERQDDAWLSAPSVITSLSKSESATVIIYSVLWDGKGMLSVKLMLLRKQHLREAATTVLWGGVVVRNDTVCV